MAFHNAYHNRYISMNGMADFYPSDPRNFDDEFPEDWTWQKPGATLFQQIQTSSLPFWILIFPPLSTRKFTVVDAGNGEVALHNSVHNRFWKMSPEGGRSLRNDCNPSKEFLM